MNNTEKRTIRIEYNRMNNADLHELAQILIDAGAIKPYLDEGRPRIGFDNVNNFEIAELRSEIAKFTFASVTKVQITKTTKTDPDFPWLQKEDVVAEKSWTPYHHNRGKETAFYYEVDVK